MCIGQHINDLLVMQVAVLTNAVHCMHGRPHLASMSHNLSKGANKDAKEQHAAAHDDHCYALQAAQGAQWIRPGQAGQQVTGRPLICIANVNVRQGLKNSSAAMPE